MFLQFIKEKKNRCFDAVAPRKPVTTAPTLRALDPKSLCHCFAVMVVACCKQDRMTVFTHSVAVVTDFDDRLILPEVPNHGLATWVSRGQDMLHLPIPGHNTDVFMRLPR